MSRCPWRPSIWRQIPSLSDVCFPVYSFQSLHKWCSVLHHLVTLNSLCPTGLQSSPDGKHHQAPSCAGKLHSYDKLAALCSITQFSLACQKADLAQALKNKTETRRHVTADLKQVILGSSVQGHKGHDMVPAGQFVTLGAWTQIAVLAHNYFTWMFRPWSASWWLHFCAMRYHSSSVLQWLAVGALQADLLHKMVEVYLSCSKVRKFEGWNAFWGGSSLQVCLQLFPRSTGWTEVTFLLCKSQFSLQ